MAVPRSPTNDQPAEEPPRSRQPLVLTIVALVIGVGLLVWLPYHRERQVIEKINSWGGRAETATFGQVWLGMTVLGERPRVLAIGRLVSFDLARTKLTHTHVAALDAFAPPLPLSLSQ